jgi:phage virion morphogenesis protein
MSRIEFDLDSRQVTEALQQLLARIDNVDPALEEIGEYLIFSTKQRFTSKTAPDGSLWPDNSPLTQALKGRNDPLRGESGRLGNEIFYQVQGGELVVGSPMEYAAMQHFGGTRAKFPHLWGDIPARPFLGVSDDDEEAVLEVLSSYLLDG